jgi:hypothetical protein
MQQHAPSGLAALLFALLTLLSLAAAQNGALGGGAGNSPQPTQYPTVTTGPSLQTAGGTTTAIYQPFTQAFVTPLGTWVFPTPLAGSIGLGNIHGTVGTVRGS